MNFSEALVHAHSSAENEAALVEDILQIIALWENIESMPNGSASQRSRIEDARVLVSALQTNWNLSIDEIDELDQYVDEFRAMFGKQTTQETHLEAC
jgi:hypothetical protein